MHRFMPLLLTMALAAPATSWADTPVIGGRCEGCELVFTGMPAEIGSEARIAPADEPGEPLVITGQVTTGTGAPAPGIVVYAYQTDAEGIYPAAGTRHGRLRGWALTDADGNYRFDTIRPASYPGTTIAQHVHMHVVEPERATYYVDDLRFADDPNVGRPTASNRARGGAGFCTPQKRDGVWSVHRNIVLGLNVPGYERLD